ncbi:hypothetical protein DDZ13_03895 [Coraliomargarita sinensis]|uniref:Uncharacterized protein n=1 Tax=Coraliomargarita sinensis TaxID=2174842 RepID=A0A317ZLK8_9BACT|nr:hypothetical protein [Coraliomargarita sinensis]PXA05113.1 hypothetical protein DDZ13_03895 [Coraliomargarita sinensis]
MQTPTFSFLATVLRTPTLTVIGIAFSLLANQLQAQDTESVGPLRTQTIELKAGWNAVYLDLEPTNAAPNDFFAGTPVGIAAAYFRPATSMEFIESPADLLGDRKNWSMWYAPGRDDHLLTDLYRMQAHQAYLIFSEEAHTFTVTGTPFYGTATFYPNTFSLVGFPIHASEAPTLGNFFAGSEPHEDMRIYTLKEGRWSLITEPASYLMEPGSAYWVFSEGASEFSGPFSVSFSGSGNGGMFYRQETGAREIVVRNEASYPQAIRIGLEAGSTGQLPLAYRVRIVNAPEEPLTATSVSMGNGLELGTLEAGQAVKLAIEVEQSQVNAALMSTTLVFTSDAGLRVDVPILSLRPDLAN